MPRSRTRHALRIFAALFAANGALAIPAVLLIWLLSDRFSLLLLFTNTLSIILAVGCGPLLLAAFFSRERLARFALMVAGAIIVLPALAMPATIRLVGSVIAAGKPAAQAYRQGNLSQDPSYILLFCVLCGLQTLLGHWLYRHLERPLPDPAPPPRPVALRVLGGLFAPPVFYLLFLTVRAAPFFIAELESRFDLHGFLELSSKGVVSVEKVLVKEGRQVRLIPMVHVGTQEFYDSLKFKAPEKRTLVLLEGLKNRQNLVKPISYAGVAKKIGAVAQDRNLGAPPPSENESESRPHADEPVFVHADIDTADLSPEARKLINDLGQVFENPFSASGKTPSLDVLSRELIAKRNQSLLKAFREREKGFDNIVIPWGALHLPGIENELEAAGYVEKPELRKKRLALSLADLVSRRK